MDNQKRQKKKLPLILRIPHGLLDKRGLHIILHVVLAISLVIWLILFIAGIIFNIITWIGIVVFGLLLAAFIWEPILYFAGEKILLQKYQKAVNRIFFFLVLLLVIWVFRPDIENWQTYKFEEDLKAIQTKRIVPDNQNAAVLYEPLLNDFQGGLEPLELFTDDERSILTGPWESEEYPQVADWLNNHSDLLERLLIISKFKRCSFPVQTEYFEFSKRYDTFDFFSKSLLASGNRDIGEKRIDAGLEKYIATLQISKHLQQQSTMMDFYSSCSIAKKSLDAISKFVVECNSVNDENLRFIMDNIDSIDNWQRYSYEVLYIHKLQVKNFLGKLYESNNKGKTRFTRHLCTNNAEKDSFSKWQKTFNIKVASVVMPLFVPYSPKTMGEIIDSIYEKLYQTIIRDSNLNEMEEFKIYKIKQLKRLKSARFPLYFLMILKDSESNCLQYCYFRNLSLLRGSQLLIALRRYKNKNNKWPEKLDDIKSLTLPETFIDPLNNDSFIYKLTDDSFKLYSKGRNRTDENGEYECGCANVKDNPDDMPIWPTQDDQNIKEQVKIDG